MKQEAEEHYKERLKFAAKTDVVVADSMEMRGEVAEELLKVHRPDPIPVQLNGIPLQQRDRGHPPLAPDRFVTKCKVIWPDLDEKELGLVFDHMEKEKANG